MRASSEHQPKPDHPAPFSHARILPVQHFISGTIVFLIIEMFAQWCYYYYLDSRLIDFFRISSVEGNASVTAMARFLLVLTSILDAARNSVSFFLLLIVAMGYGVIRPSIGPVMTRVRILTAVHFIFGVLYSVGIVLIQIDQGGAWIFIFIFPLAMTLTAFLMWIMNSLNHSIEHLTQRKQTFKRSMFVKLHRILLGAVVVIVSLSVIAWLPWCLTFLSFVDSLRSLSFLPLPFLSLAELDSLLIRGPTAGSCWTAGWDRSTLSVGLTFPLSVLCAPR